LETGAAAVEVGESGRPVVEVEGDQVVEEEKPLTKEEQINALRAKEQAEGKAEAPQAGSVVGGDVKIETLNPTGSIFVDYSAEQRDKMPLGKNITTYDKTAGLSPDKKITVYRGVPKNINEIQSGDFVTTNKQLAQDYAGDGKVISKEVRADEILDDKTEPLGEEYILREQSIKEAPKPKGKTEGFTEGKDLTKIFAASKAKYGEKEGAKYNDVANRLVNPNTNTIIEVRSNGVVVKEGGKYLLKPFINTDANYKKWELGKGLDVSEQFEKAEGGKTKDKEGVKAAPKTNKIGGYEFTATPSLTEEDGLKVDRLSKSEADQIAMQVFVSDANKSTQEGVTNEGGGWYSFDTDSFGGKTLYNKETGEAVALSHKKGGRMGAVINDFIANNSRTQEQEVSLLEPFRTKDKEGQAARAALKESVGPAEYKRLENIAKNGEKILKSFDGKIIKIDCP
jgi:hypothetical protein